ncbi:hypothetical protein FZC76_03990 [Sutcliffiella horikoshii]|uniref:Uncharacterized protein n=1 Tax=Sutcliffiella horikoshii TaxID=79883 RepID=A0A5D4T1D8_9BACI|nr:hypothetical protein FZC76_03990 [Sutcliffiella horikoshii]
MLRPRRLAEEAQGRPAESEAICGNQQRLLTNTKNLVIIQWRRVMLSCLLHREERKRMWS